MIENRNRSRFLPVFICLLVVMLFSSYLGANAQINGNTTQTPYYYSGTVSPAVTPIRDKQNYSSVYINNLGTSRPISAVRIFGCVAYSGEVVDEQDCTVWVLPLAAGDDDYFYNNVKEYGFYYTRLKLSFSSSVTSAPLNITWSPDSY